MIDFHLKGISKKLIDPSSSGYLVPRSPILAKIERFYELGAEPLGVI